MRNQSHKTNQFLQSSLKLLVVMAALFFIGYKITGDEQLSFPAFLESLRANRVFSSGNVGILLLLSVLNWLFEIRKWQVLSSDIRRNSLVVAARESLASFTAAIFTPSRIGEYGAKALFYGKGDRKKVIFRNFLGNFSQLLISLIFGVLGLIYFLSQIRLPLASFNFLWLGIILFAPIGLYRFLRKRSWNIQGHSVQSLENALRFLPKKIKLQTLFFAGLRYLIFTHQFYYFLLVFGVDIPYGLLISAVASMYLLSSIIPTMMIFDALIKGGFGVWIFSFLGVGEMVVLVVVLAVWILNFGLPALVGSYYVLKYKSPEKVIT